MAVITAITIQKRNKKRANIFLDGNYHCSLETITIASSGLKPGMEIGEDDLASLQLRSEAASAFDKAIGYISARQRTAQEISKYLEGKGYLLPVIENCIAKLTEYRYVDDGRFIDSYISTYKTKYGKIKLRHELLRLGVPAAEVERKLEELGGQQEECRAAAEKYARTRKHADRNKLITFLMSKGFTYEECKAVADEVIQNNKDDDYYE